MGSGLPLSLTVGAVSFILAVIWGGPLVEILHHFRIGKNIRPELEEHRHKTGTPTMGGILIVLPVIIITLALNIANIVRPGTNALTGPSVLLPLFVMISYGAIGAVDDWMGVRRAQG